MSLKFLIDMNLSPLWAGYLSAMGWETVHWSSIGDATAPDETLVEWAIANGHVIITQDLDFSRLLALSRNHAPSVIQVRGEDTLPGALGPLAMKAIRRFEAI